MSLPPILVHSTASGLKAFADVTLQMMKGDTKPPDNDHFIPPDTWFENSWVYHVGVYERYFRLFERLDWEDWELATV